MIDGLIVQYQAVEGQGEVPNMDDLEGTYIEEIEPAAGETYSDEGEDPPRGAVSGDAGGETDMINEILSELPWRN